MSAISPTIEHELTKLFSFGHSNNFRVCLVLAGSEQWCRQMTRARIVYSNTVYSNTIYSNSNSGLSDDYHRELSNSQLLKFRLGTDSELVVIDAWSGLNPDVMGQVIGTLRGGGLMLLTTPPFDEWPDYNDPDYSRYQAIRPEEYIMEGNFIRRFRQLLEQQSVLPENKFLTVIQQNLQPKGHSYSFVQESLVVNSSEQKDGAVKKDSVDTKKTIGPKLFDPTEDQEKVISDVVKILETPRSAILLEADRGRGKSVALGLAVQRLLKSTPCHIVVTAPLRVNVEHFFLAVGDVVDSVDKSLRFMAVDQLLIDTLNGGSQNGSRLPVDLLIVDEAAAIPLPILNQLILQIDRVVFSSTLHGYEGSGRGFSVRFKHTLSGHFDSCSFLSLHQPIRWACDDPMELFFNDLLLLATDVNAVGSEIKKPAAVVAKNSIAMSENLHSEYANIPQNTNSPVLIRLVSGRQLLASEPMLREVFALLIDAHYQTRPSDLRYLLDVPYANLWLAEQVVDGASRIVGVLLCCEEGGFGRELSELADLVVVANRRPQGNMLAQLLANYSGDSQWLRAKSMRVMRIAVREGDRRQGIGTQLLSALEVEAVKRGCAYWGSSFGFDLQLLDFWQRHSAVPVHLGLRLDKASGARNLMVVRALSRSFEQKARLLSHTLVNDLRWWQRGYFPELSDDHLLRIKDMLLATHPEIQKADGSYEPEKVEVSKSTEDKIRLSRFITGELTFDKVYPALCRLFLSRVDKDVPSLTLNLPVTQISLGLAPDWAEMALKLRLSGRKQVIEAVKAELIQATAD